MFGSNNGARAYAKVGVETGVAAASPHKLVLMLFEGAMVAVASGIHHMQANDVAAKGQAISKAISIINDGLRASLDKRVGGEIALNLDALYEYISDRLVTANMKNQIAVLEEIYQLLKGLRDAWESIAPPPETAAAPAPAWVPPPVNDPLAPQTSRLVKA